jgi:hypothetical protein
MCWAAWHVYRSAHFKTWLARVYPGLAGYVNFWLRYHTSSRGLPRYFNAGQIADNDARFDRVYNRTSDQHSNEPISGFESPGGRAEDRDSQPEYVWTTSAAIELLLERYRIATLVINLNVLLRGDPS